jgi:hypothetical protein
MKRKCKDGYIALVTNKEPGCEFNIGKLVRVSGQMSKNKQGLVSWFIEPLERRLWWCLSPFDELECRMATFKCRIKHPDAWLLPIGQETSDECSKSTSDSLETV